MRLSMRVWDLPVRVFHWGLIVLLGATVAAWFAGRQELHRELGEAVLVLVLWRVVWGIVGSDTARFGHFLGAPVQKVGRAPEERVGNSALTGWWLVVLLLVLLVACLSGFSVQARLVHVGAVLALGGLAVLHLVQLGVAAAAGQPVVRPMLSGKKRMPAAMRAPRMAPAWFALLVLFSVGGVVWLMLGWLRL